MPSRTRIAALINIHKMINTQSSIRLFQLISPSLPIGSFTYSQGLEWAFETGWLNDAEALEKWLNDLMHTTVLNLELPVLCRLIAAWQNKNIDQVQYWNRFLIANRETAELKQEELNRGRAIAKILASLMSVTAEQKTLIAANQSSGFAYAVVNWNIDVQQACEGFIWSWLENLVLVAVKIIPLGQTQGQQCLFKLAQQIPTLYQQAQQLSDDELGNSSMALAIASSLHETQYTRLYRS